MLRTVRDRSGVLPSIANEMVTKWSSLFRLESYHRGRPVPDPSFTAT
jgi:hypothetical protein